MHLGGGIILNCFSVRHATSHWIKMNFCLLLVVLCFAVCAYAQQYAQQYGPLPPRPQQFVGATLVQPPRPNFRQRPISPRVIPEVIQPIDQTQATRLRRPQPLKKVRAQFSQPQVLDQPRTNLIEDVPPQFTNKVVAPTPLVQFQQQTPKLLTPRPVEEEVNEDEETATTVVTTPSTTTFAQPLRSYPPPPAPAPLQQSQVPAGFQRTQFLQQSAFRPPAAQPAQPVQYPEPVLQGRQLVRQQVRPIQPVQVSAGRPLIQQSISPQLPVTPEPVPEDEQYFRQVQNRPLKKQEPVRQQIIEREPPLRQQPVRQPEVLRQQPEVIRQQPVRTQDYLRPTQREPHVKAPQRERKPVAQTIRKYHEEHEDGSITWGYENDDGSFKEETIGIDCVTRGKYGYFDPDGVKREYTYQTGIPCDRTQESEEAASNQGFIDYTNNKYVLPNGDEIDLEAMVKNRARKPVPQYRN